MILMGLYTFGVVDLRNILKLKKYKSKKMAINGISLKKKNIIL
jgi:hypothetical protein